VKEVRFNSLKTSADTAGLFEISKNHYIILKITDNLVAQEFYLIFQTFKSIRIGFIIYKER